MDARKHLLATMVTIGVAGNSVAAPGELDPEFGANGLATFKFGRGTAVLQQPDGKLLIAVEARGADNFEVLRLNADGSRDPSFGANGTATIDFSSNDKATDLALTIDGKIVVAGMANAYSGDPQLAVGRLNPDGTLDPSFDGDGRVLIDTDHGASLSSVVASADGRVVAAGSRSGPGSSDMVFLRLRADGSLDPTFGNSDSPGIVVVDSGLRDDLKQLLLLPDGKYLACGQAQVSAPVYVETMLAVRLNQDGSVDSGFGGAGFAGLDTVARGYSSAAEACAVLPDGTIVLAGWERRGPLDQAAILMRLRSDGVRDTATWDEGLSVLGLGNEAAALAIVAVDDDVVVSGHLDADFSGWDPSMGYSYVARVSGTNGRLDEGFGHHGVTTIDFSRGAAFGSNAQLAALFKQTDGKLVAVGATSLDGSSEVAVARIDPSGSAHAGIAGFRRPAYDGNNGVSLEVRRTGGSTGTLLVDFHTVDGSAVAPADYTETRGTLIWGDGDYASKTIDVPTAPGARAGSGPLKRFTVLLSAPETSLALDESWVYLVAHPPAAVIASTGGGSNSSGTSSSAGGGGAAGLETLLLLWLAMLHLCRRRLNAARTANCITAS